MGLLRARYFTNTKATLERQCHGKSNLGIPFISRIDSNPLGDSLPQTREQRKRNVKKVRPRIPFHAAEGIQDTRL